MVKIKSLLDKDYIFWIGNSCKILKPDEEIEVENSKANWLIKYKIAEQSLDKVESGFEVKSKSKKKQAYKRDMPE